MEAFIVKLIGDESDVKTNASTGKRLELPVWDLAVRGELHRREIYDDER